MKKDAEHISVITVRAIPRPKLMVLRTSRHVRSTRPEFIVMQLFWTFLKYR